MAKTNKNQNEEEIQDLSQDNSTQEAVASPDREVRVRGLENHKCTIGSTPIIVEKNKETKMTVGQAMILQSANIVAILA